MNLRIRGLANSVRGDAHIFTVVEKGDVRFLAKMNRVLCYFLLTITVISRDEGTIGWVSERIHVGLDLAIMAEYPHKSSEGYI